MRRKLILLGGTTTAAVGLVMAMMPTATAITNAKNITVVAPSAEIARIDLGKRGPSLGDLYAFSGPLKMRGESRSIGRLDGQCTTTSNPAGPQQQRQQCNITATFEEEDGAEINLQGVGRVLAEDVDFSVVGGSGRYANVRGEATFDFRNADRVVIHFRLIP